MVMPAHARLTPLSTMLTAEVVGRTAEDVQLKGAMATSPTLAQHLEAALGVGRVSTELTCSSQGITTGCKRYPLCCWNLSRKSLCSSG